MFDFFDEELQGLWTEGDICLDMLVAGNFKSKLIFFLEN